MRSDTWFEPRLIADRYRVTGYLGGGGMADVFRAVDTRLNRPVAVKVFKASADSAGRARFEREATLLASLDHPGLVTLYDTGFTEGEPFLVMKLVEGETLAERLADGPLSPAEVVDLGQQLTAILSYVHSKNVIHRDVKPSNVLLDAQGRVFLADFGISRLINATARATAAGKVMGTVGYLSPEQVLGADATQAVDVYALGLVLLECVTGRAEYEGTGVEVALARLHRPPRVPRELTPPLSTTIAAMTAPKAEQRPSMAECAAMLAGETPAGPKKSRRGWLVASSAVTGFAAIVAGAAVIPFSGTVAPDGQAPAPAASSPPPQDTSAPPAAGPTSPHEQPETAGPLPRMGPVDVDLPSPAGTSASTVTTTIHVEMGTTSDSGDTAASSGSPGNGKGKGKGNGNGNGNAHGGGNGNDGGNGNEKGKGNGPGAAGG